MHHIAIREKFDSVIVIVFCDFPFLCTLSIWEIVTRCHTMRYTPHRLCILSHDFTSFLHVNIGQLQSLIFTVLCFTFRPLLRLFQATPLTFWSSGRHPCISLNARIRTVIPCRSSAHPFRSRDLTFILRAHPGCPHTSSSSCTCVT